MKTQGTKLLEVNLVFRILAAFFKSTPHEIFGRITQILTGHGYTGEYYKRMHLEESPWCPCSRDSPDAPVLTTPLRILWECAVVTMNNATSSPKQSKTSRTRLDVAAPPIR